MKRRAALSWLSALPWAAWGARAGAEPGHSGLRARVGPPNAPHAMPGGDAERSRRAATRLGASPRVERRLRVAFGVGHGLTTARDGGFFVLHPSARASRFDPQGKLLFSLKLPSEAASPPVVTSGGSLVFLAFGELYWVDELGRVKRTPLGESDLSARSILATRDGGVLLASVGFLIKLSAFGDVSFRKATPEASLEVLETTAGLLCVSNAGSVFRVDGSGRLRKLGELGGTTQAVTASGDGSALLARTGSHRLASFDLVEHRLRASIEDATLDLDGPVLLSTERLAQVFTNDGLLIRYRPDGSEAQRVPIDPGARKAPGPDDALLLADGRLLVARTGADAVIVTPSGEVSSIAGSACPDPVGLFAAGPGAVLLACRSGNLLKLV